ncbi:hypothetical protein RHOSPDRAFT_15117 [Rhodotorula sp. JG-1b]|nr:hypothetical protein RHOSPDRAFT_15117 [Rhodotorula sp. JG-1b]
MDAADVPWTEPIASTSRAVFTLPYKAVENEETEELGWSGGVEAYRTAWKACHQQIQNILSTLHDASLDQIVAFVRTPESDDADLYATLSGRALLRTGLVVGASPGSSSLLYSSLVRQLSGTTSSDSDAASSRPCLVSRLTSRDCSNIKNALRSLIGGFIGSDLDVELEYDEDEDEEVFTTGPATRRNEMLVPEDMLNLQAWYEHRFAKRDADSAPKLVVLIEDLEAMDGKVLTQMIDTLSAYTDKLPITLLVGIATTADALWTLLGRKTANKLDAATFFVDPGVGAFNALMRGLFIDWCAPLALSPKVYDNLWRTFDDLHHSIDATISFIQNIYMSHYIASPVRSLYPATTATSLVGDAAEALEDLQSLDCYKEISGEGRPAEEVLQAARASYAAWHAARKEAFHVLVRTMEFWDKRKPLESTLSAVLGDGDGGRGILKTIDELCNLVLQASSAKLPNYLRAVLSRLEALATTTTGVASTSTSTPNSNELQSFLAAQLSALEPILAARRPAGRSTLFNTNLAGAFSIPGTGSASKMDQDFSRLAKETAEGLKQRLRHAFRPPTELALHQLWFSEDRSAIKRFFPATLPATLRLLQKDSTFTDDRAAADDDDGGGGDNPDRVDAPPTTRAQHDLAVAYRTYTDTHPQGRLANLGEWWGAFELGAAEEVVEEGGENGQEEGQFGNGAGGGGGGGGKNGGSDEDEDEEGSDEDDDGDESEDDEGPERRKQARFLRAVGDLAHLGFIHPTTYKAEHVLKSVY